MTCVGNNENKSLQNEQVALKEMVCRGRYCLNRQKCEFKLQNEHDKFKLNNHMMKNNENYRTHRILAIQNAING